MTRIILLAPPLSGKGTQAQLLKERCGFVPISTGDLLRRASTSLDDEGRQLAKILASGELVSDDIVIHLLAARLEEIGMEKILLDGFPRNLHQVELLDELLQSKNASIDVVVFLDVPKEILLSRIEGRRVCECCGKIYQVTKDEQRCTCGGELITRSDDNVSSFEARYQQYLEITMPLVSYYSSCGKLVRIDGCQEKEEVYQDILKALKERCEQ